MLGGDAHLIKGSFEESAVHVVSHLSDESGFRSQLRGGTEHVANRPAGVSLEQIHSGGGQPRFGEIDKQLSKRNNVVHNDSPV